MSNYSSEIHPSLAKRIRRRKNREARLERMRRKRVSRRILDRQMGRRIAPSLRKAIFQRDSFTCRYCGVPARTIDHVLAFSKGGKSIYENLVVSCEPCQRQKDDLLPEEAGMTIIPLHPLALEYEKFRNERTQWGYWDGTH